MEKINPDKKKIAVVAAEKTGDREDITDAYRCCESIKEVLKRAGYDAEIIMIGKDLLHDEPALVKFIKKSHFCVFNIFEGFSDDSSSEYVFAEILEKNKIPFTGNSSFTLKTCLDKYKTKQMLLDSGISAPVAFFVKHLSDLNTLARDMIAFPYFIKPCYEDASLGIDSGSLVRNKDELAGSVIRKLQEFPSGLIVEEFIGGKEYNAGLFGPGKAAISGVSVIEYLNCPGSNPFLTYSSKWDRDSVDYKSTVPKILTKNTIDEDFRNEIISIAIRTCRIFNCRGYMRVDMREKDGNLYVIDVNPNPDINTDSGFMRQAAGSGYTYDDATMKIFSIAFERYGQHA